MKAAQESARQKLDQLVSRYCPDLGHLTDEELAEIEQANRRADEVIERARVRRDVAGGQS